MKKLIVSAFLVVGMVVGANGAPAARNVRGTSTNTSSSVARSAVSTRGTNSSNASPSVARSAVSGRNASTQGVVGRAATVQKVVNSGTKIAGAAKNIAINEECQNKYFGCMDAFCMLDNTSGGRCICSDKNAELDSILADIEELDQQSYQMATLGVEQIEMGDNADAAIAKANAVADSVLNTKKSSRKALDLSMWDMSASFDTYDNIFTSDNVIDGKTGDALHSAAAELCMAQIPECSAESSMLQLLYAQRIKSDCSAYENSLKQQKNASQTKLSTAQRALREAALEQYQNANKYDLGQCTVQFKRCMQTTGECGDDFSKCASVAAFDNTNATKSMSKKAKNYTIKGSITSIEISASTYDALMAKKPLCEHITRSCVAVADNVWETFLREVAPQIKSAELIAEDNARQSCIGNISQCFQKACKDNIDPNDPDGSYDMCLTRPETMLNLCKIPLNACGINATSVAAAEKSQIWGFVVARLASMRIDSCTNSVKSCLQSDDRCGSDYSQCIGLDLNTIISMCPTDKLVGCQENGTKKSLSEISDLVLGIFLDIDNTMLTQCQSAVTTKMLELCGDTSTCAAFDNDDVIGTESLMSYKDNDGNYVIDGLVSFGNVRINEVDGESNPEDVKFGRYEINIADYKDHLNDTNATVQRVVSSLQSTANKINQKIAVLSQDPQIKMCVEGRDMTQIRSRTSDATTIDRTSARYPNLLDSSILAIVNSGMERANQNYTKKYNKLVGDALESQSEEIKSVLCAAMASTTQPMCTEYDTKGICIKYEPSNFDNVFGGSTDSGMADMTGGVYATRYVISGANMSRLASVQQLSHSEYVQTDSYGNMLGRILMNAVYSPATHKCTLTTESVMCKDAESVITTNTEKSCTNVNLFSFTGGSGCGNGGGIIQIGGGGSKTNVAQSYHGTPCKEFGESVITTSVIEM